MIISDKKTFSWWLINYLHFEQKVNTTFLMTGGGVFHLCNALSEQREKIKSYFFYHEQQAVFAAEGISKLTNEICLVIGTSGPGATNLITGLVSCYQDSIPLIAITGQCKSNDYKLYDQFKEIRQAGTFDNDFTKFSREYTKSVFQIKNIDEGIVQVANAINIAKSGRPGPVVIEIPLDIQGALMEESLYIRQLKKIKPIKNHFSKFDIQKSKILKNLKLKIIDKRRISILVGRGCNISNSWEMVYEIAREFNLPIVSTYGAKEEKLIELSQWCGVVGLKGSYAGNNVLDQSDLIISLGNSLHQQTVGWEIPLFLKNKEIIYVDIDKNLCQKFSEYKEIFSINLDLKVFLNLLTEFLTENSTIMHKDIHNWQKTWQRLKMMTSIIDVGKNFNKGFSLYHVMDKFNSFSMNNSAIVADSGTTWYVTGQVLNLKKGQAFITSSAMGSMGFALPASAGISASSNYHTYCLVGDGSIMTSLSSLWTIARDKLPITIMIINNLGYNSISNTQEKFGGQGYYGSTFDSGLASLDFKLIAKSCSIEYVRVDDEDSLNSELLSKKGPLIIDIFIDTKTVVVPFVKSVLQTDGSFKSGSLINLEPSPE